MPVKYDDGITNSVQLSGLQKGLMDRETITEARNRVFHPGLKKRLNYMLINSVSELEVTPEEDEAWSERCQQAVKAATTPQANSQRSKYHVEIRPGVWIDVYDVLQAFGVTNSALQHLIKKALKPGGRGHKDLATDLNDIVVSAKRAMELENLK